MLEADGFDIIGEAGDGASALLLMRQLRPDVVLLDVQLPDMNGFDVCSSAATSTRRPSCSSRAVTRVTTAL